MTSIKTSLTPPTLSSQPDVHHLADSFRVAPDMVVVDGGPAFSSRLHLTVVTDPSSRLVLSCAVRA